MKVIECDYGISSRYGDGRIEINRKLQGDLRRKILAHELRHSKGKYTKKDFDNDFSSKKPYFFESLGFALHNPEAFINFFPFMYSYYSGQWSFNMTSMMPLFLYGFIFSVLAAFIFKVNFGLGFTAWINFIAIANLASLAYTHKYVKSRQRQI